jgi:putative membrane protein
MSEQTKESKMKKQHTAMAVLAGLTMFLCASALAQAPSDPQIVQVVKTANKIDIDHAKIALRKSKNQQIKDFANQMISDHTSLEKSVADLSKKLNVTPQESDTSKQLQQQATDEAKKLRSLSGDAFDREYLSHEVAFHQAVIDAASKTLIPNAKNAELKSALEGAAPLLQAHMQHAQQLQQSLDAGK